MLERLAALYRKLIEMEFYVTALTLEYELVEFQARPYPDQYKIFKQFEPLLRDLHL